MTPLNTAYPKRLIEVDLPIARISAHARREKSIRHGHISTLHIWWARRPLAACRAVICAALWPDPADPLCPPPFRAAAARTLHAFARRVFPDRITDEKQHLQATASAASKGRWEVMAKHAGPLDAADPAVQNVLRFALLDFIADFANWDNSTTPAYLDAARALTQAAHEALGGEPGTRPLVADPFAGGGSIPLEALRVGADAFASDLNPVAVLLNKVVLEYIPKYGQKLADEVRKWGAWVQEMSAKRLKAYYPSADDGSHPIAYLWARTIVSEAPGDSNPIPVEVPMLRSMWLAKASNSDRALMWIRDDKGIVQTRVVTKTFADGTSRKVRQPQLKIVAPSKGAKADPGTVGRGSVTCPVTGYTTPVADVRVQLHKRRGGAADAVQLAVRQTNPATGDRTYRPPTELEHRAAESARESLDRTWIPDEPLPPAGALGFRVQKYGMLKWGDLFSPRQAFSLSVIGAYIQEAGVTIRKEHDAPFAIALQTCLALVFGRLTDFTSSLCTLNATGNRGCKNTFTRQALAMVWDYMETVPTNLIGANWLGGVDTLEATIRELSALDSSGTIVKATATAHSLPDGAVQAFCTDPPYYDAVPYSDLSDYFYVWLKRVLPPDLGYTEQLTPKMDECILDESKGKDTAYFEKSMAAAMAEGRRILASPGIGFVVFAHKSTSGWEAQLRAMLNAGWTITASWPIDTERPGRLRAMNSAALASSVHLVCRPRQGEAVGDWRDVLAELPVRMHEWMPRLANEGVVGADAIFACLGPALEIFSRYARVEKSNGDAVALKEYLEHVWAAVSKEAISTIFRDADATGLEPDARLTAVWLWTLGNARDPAAPAADPDAEPADESEDDEEEDAGGKAKKGAKKGFFLEFDAARKIAQGLGIHLEQSGSVVEVKGESARLLPVSERTAYLFGKAATPAGEKAAVKKKKAAPALPGMEADPEPTAKVAGVEITAAPPGVTVLDRLHQAMILFGAQRGELLKRFLVDDGAGKDARLWSLAQALAALYPLGTDERRWVEGVLARKKGLGL